MIAMQRPYLQNYMTFYYEYLPKINKHNAKKVWCKIEKVEEEETEKSTVLDQRLS